MNKNKLYKISDFDYIQLRTDEYYEQVVRINECNRHEDQNKPCKRYQTTNGLHYYTGWCIITYEELFQEVSLLVYENIAQGKQRSVNLNENISYIIFKHYVVPYSYNKDKYYLEQISY